MNYKEKNILIMGLGLYEKGSGVTALRYFYNHGAKITVTDLKTKEQLEPQLKRLKTLKGVNYVLGQHRPEDFIRADVVVKNPGVRADNELLKLAKQNGALIVSDISIFLTACKNPVIGVTGTRGKSTTSTLIHEFVKTKFPKSRLGGNIQISPMTFVDELDGKSPVVLELSSWQCNSLREVKISPQISVATNIMVDHLNAYPDFESYVADKALIFAYQHPSDLAVLNMDDVYTRSFAKEAIGSLRWFSLEKLEEGAIGVYWNSKGELIYSDGHSDKLITKASSIAIKGEHNLSNVAAATVVALEVGVSLANIKKVLKKFKGLPYRQEVVRVYKKRTFINDTTATTPDATLAALRAMKKKPIIICGGTDKVLDFKELIRELPKLSKKIVFLPGTATEKIKKYLKPGKAKVFEVESMKEAVELAWEGSVSGDIILLSPGAASFGLFQNEFDRGDKFNACVKGWRR